MKTYIITLLTAIVSLTIGCRKESIPYPVNGIDLARYESILGNNYDKALDSHIRLLDSKSLSVAEFKYYSWMFHENDSLFSLHFYDFCTDYVDYEGFPADTHDMMGNNHGMMGGMGYYQNGWDNSGYNDPETVLENMQAIYQTVCSEADPDYEDADSLMFNQMVEDKSFLSATGRIPEIFGMMQELRAIHKSSFGF